MNVRVRKATVTDVPRLREVIDASVRGLQAGDYSPAQIEGALRTVYGVDSQLIADGTYFVAEIERSDTGRPDGVGADAFVRPASEASPRTNASGATHFEIVGCGGWSRRKTLYGGDQYAGREDSLLDPARDAAKIRAFFVHPNWARRGIGGLILEACEDAACRAGFTRLEMGATLTGVAFYRAKGYVEVENQEAALGNGESLPIVRMAKEVTGLNRKDR